MASLHIYPCICSVVPCLRVLWMSTHGCFLPPFFPFPFFLVVATRCWSPGARRHRRRRPLLHWRCLLLRAARWRRPRVVRRIPGRRPAPLSICIPVCASHLMATCLTYVCTQILLLPLTRLWSSSCIRALEAPGLYYDACMTYFICRVVLWYLPVSPWSWSYTFACMISVRLNRGRHITIPWDHLIPLGTSSMLCELINLIHSWLSLDQPWIFATLFIWMMSWR